MKSRKEKSENYNEKYFHIPKDFDERVSWLYDSLNINETKALEIINKKNEMLSSLYYTEINIILYEEPEGAPRPRFRLVNRKNLMNQAMSNPNFIHVYSPTGKSDNMHMKRLVTENDFNYISTLLYTPCDVEYTTYSKTPSVFSSVDKFLAEIGLIRPITKPDWDNIGKKYSDMFNNNIWIDDALVITGIVRKFYSVLPRVEIKLKYLNMLYNRYQTKSIMNKIGPDEIIEFFERG